MGINRTCTELYKYILVDSMEIIWMLCFNLSMNYFKQKHCNIVNGALFHYLHLQIGAIIKNL